LTIFFVSVFTQLAYLRYLLPALVLFAILAGWALEELPDRPVMRVLLLTIGTILVLLNVRFLYTANWTNSDLCPKCAFDAATRYRNIAAFAPQRVIGEYLNRALPDGRVGFFILNEASPAGYTGYSRGGSWHDYDSFRTLARAQSAEDILKLARRYGLTHAVVPDAPTAGPTDVVGAFRDRYTSPVWQFQGHAVVAIQPDAAAAPAETPGAPPMDGSWTTKLLRPQKPSAGSANAPP
jgi:branched-subunit amino acid ABC-type transport system permease component